MASVTDRVMSDTELRRLAYSAAIWGTPIVSFDAMRQAFLRDAGAKYGDLIYLSRFADWRFRVTTPNASTRYVVSFFNTRDGPVVLEIPPAVGAGLFGSILDAWQVPLADVGPQGSDQGKGGKYLLLPPGYSGPVPGGYIPVASGTFNLYAAFRAISEGSSEAAVGRALGLVNAIRIYPLAKAGAPPPTRAIDMAGRPFDGIMAYDESFYASLARMLDEEPVLPRDAAMIERLKPLRIEKGRPFAPTPALRNLMNEAAHNAQHHFVAEEAHEGAVFWPGARWRAPSAAGAKTGFSFETDKGLDVEARGLTYFMACAPPKVLGKASMYLMTFLDGAAQPLSGNATYRLRIPVNPPAEQFWAVTVYDAETCAFIRNSPKLEVNSYHEGLRPNADGSIDIIFSADPPAGGEANWVATARGRAWFPMLRFYGPKPALFDKTWRAPDIERIGEAANRPKATPVTTENFIRAETDKYFGVIARRGFGKFYHFRELPLESTVVRPNRDTLYSEAVFDLDAGPVTITLPDVGQRFMSLMVMDQDHYVVEVVYGAGAHTYTRESVGTRYVFAALRTLVDPASPQDYDRAHALQDAAKAEQKATGAFDVPNWDPASQKKVRNALLTLNESLPDLRGAFGRRGQVDPIRHLIATASAWGGNPEADAIYLNVTPPGNDGRTAYRLSVRDVPVEAFWSVSVYDAAGHFRKNDRNAYSVNSLTARRDTDGSVTIQFGACGDGAANCLPIFKGWNYLVRLYRPRPEALSGKWTFPEAKPLD